MNDIFYIEIENAGLKNVATLYNPESNTTILILHDNE